MSVILIVSLTSASDREFATSLADRLGCSLVQPEVVIERAAARGFSQQDLREAREKPPDVWQRFLHKRRIHMTMLRVALIPASAECIPRCVRTQAGVNFALHDGAAMYILSDQAGGARFAGLRVARVGSLDRETKTLTATSIRSL